MSSQQIVIKVSGKELDEPLFIANLGQALVKITCPLVLVHGGGKEITQALEASGQTVQFIDGLRVTPPESMAIMEMVVSGRINKRVVAHLVMAGKLALGLSGVDLGLLRCEPHRPGGVDLGRVGKVTSVASEVLQALLALNWLPVIAPVALGKDDGLPYNVNADHVAQAVAVALTSQGETELLFLSDVPGVLVAGQVVPQLTATAIEQAIQTGTITGGMIPKVRSALVALAAGVQTVRITNLAGLESQGTRIIA